MAKEPTPPTPESTTPTPESQTPPPAGKVEATNKVTPPNANPTPPNATPSKGAPTPAATAPVPETPKPTPRKFNIHLSLTTKVLLLAFLLILLGGQLILFSTFNKQVKQAQSVTQVSETQSQSHLQLEQQLDTFKTQIEQINRSFPDEPGLVNLIQVIDRHLSAFPEGKLQFDTNDPITAQGESVQYLPVTIIATAPMADFNRFQTYLANSPYLFLPLELKVSVPEGLDKQVKVILKGRLYVSPNI